MKILYISPANPESPSDMPFIRSQIQSLAKHRIATKLFYLRSRTSPWKLICSLFSAWKLGRNWSPDIIHAQFGTVTSMFAGILGFLLWRPVIITFRGSDLNSTPSDGYFRNMFQILLSQASVLFATQVICVSARLKNKIWWRFIPVSIISNGVDTSKFRPLGRAEARRALGWNLDMKVILFNAGKSPANKRLDIARAVESELNRDGRLSIKLEVLCGNVDSDLMPLYLNASDCVLLTSENEGSPNIVKEAMACNIPVVAVDVGDVRQVLDGTCGNFIAEREIVDLSSKVRSALAIGYSNSRVNVESAMSENVAACSIISVYKSLKLRGN